jgi:hypothetical protein
MTGEPLMKETATLAGAAGKEQLVDDNRAEKAVKSPRELEARTLKLQLSETGMSVKIYDRTPVTLTTTSWDPGRIA